jgi:TRAP-type transport system periplasmic protein
MGAWAKWGFCLVAGAACMGSASAAEVELKIAHFLPASSVTQTELIEPWVKALEEQSGGRITARIFPSMQLGGRPQQLIDQVRDGVADVVWTLPSYTPGRFPVISVFELPFMVSDAVATSQAVQAFYEEHARDGFADIHPILFHVHARGVIHTTERPVRTVEDFAGLKIRAPSRAVGEALAAFGATPVSMPVPQTPEALSKNVIDGAVVPWEVTLPLRLYELTSAHTETAGPRGLYTAVFLLAMNKARYESLPEDLKAVIDANSGMALAEPMGRAWEEAESAGREAARARGNTIVTMEAAEVARLEELARPVIDAWVAEIDDMGRDGELLLDAARGLIDRYTSDGN